MWSSFWNVISQITQGFWAILKGFIIGIWNNPIILAVIIATILIAAVILIWKKFIK